MKDPARLATGDDELARLVGSAEADVLDDGSVDRVKRGLAAAGLLATGSTVATTAKATGTLKALLGATTTKIAIVLVVGGAATAGGYRYMTRRTPDAVTPPTVTHVATPEITTPIVAPPPVVATIAPEPVQSATPVAHVKPAPTVAATVAPIETSAAPSPREGLLLLQARQRLAADPQRALDLVRQHEREYPNSQLLPERAKLKADAIAAGAK